MKSMIAKLKVEYIGKNKLFLHQEVGKGNLADGRECRLIMTDKGVVMQVTVKNEWESYAVSWMDISKAIADIVPKFEEKKDAENVAERV